MEYLLSLFGVNLFGINDIQKEVLFSEVAIPKQKS